MVQVINYSSLFEKDKFLSLLKENSEAYGAIMISADNPTMESALQILRKFTRPIIHHSPKKLYDSQILDKFSLQQGGYAVVNNQSYSHIMRFMYLGHDIEIAEHKDESISICRQLASSVKVFYDVTTIVLKSLETVYNLPPQILTARFEESHYFLEYNYYFPVTEDTQIAGAEKVDNQFMRMKPHIDTWAITLTIPVLSGKNALQFMDNNGEYYPLFFPENCFFLHYGSALKKWSKPHNLPIHIPIHRVVTDTARQERFSCLIKFTDEAKP